MTPCYPLAFTVTRSKENIQKLICWVNTSNIKKASTLIRKLHRNCQLSRCSLQKVTTLGFTYLETKKDKFHVIPYYSGNEDNL